MADVRRAADVALQLGAYSCETRGVKIVFRLPPRSDQVGSPTRKKEQATQPSAKLLKERQRSRARKDKFHADIRDGIRVPKMLQPNSGSLSPLQPVGSQVEDESSQSAASSSAKHRRKETGPKTPTKPSSDERSEESPRRKNQHDGYAMDSSSS